MRPTFSSEIGRMRAEEMRQRADRYRLAQMAKKQTEEEEVAVVAERRRSFSLRRIFAVATGALVMALGFSTVAFARVIAPAGGGGGGAGEGAGPVVTPAVSFDFGVTPFLVAVATAAVLAVGVVAVARWNSPRVA